MDVLRYETPESDFGFRLPADFPGGSDRSRASVSGALELVGS